MRHPHAKDQYFGRDSNGGAMRRVQHYDAPKGGVVRCTVCGTETVRDIAVRLGWLYTTDLTRRQQDSFFCPPCGALELIPGDV